MNKRRFNSNKGFSLVELAIGLAVVTILILAISMSAGIRDNARVQSAANSVQTLRAAAENYLVSGKINYAGMTVDGLKTEKLLPDGFNASQSNPWGGNFDVAANASDNTHFDIVLGGLAKNDADKLTSYFNNSASGSMFDGSKNIWTVTF